MTGVELHEKGTKPVLGPSIYFVLIYKRFLYSDCRQRIRDPKDPPSQNNRFYLAAILQPLRLPAQTHVGFWPNG